MTKLNRPRFETFNADEEVPTAKRLHKPRYHAVEVDGDPGVFRCPSKDALFYGESQLREWAALVDCELVIARWSQGKDDSG